MRCTTYHGKQWQTLVLWSVFGWLKMAACLFLCHTTPTPVHRAIAIPTPAFPACNRSWCCVLYCTFVYDITLHLDPHNTHGHPSATNNTYTSSTHHKQALQYVHTSPTHVANESSDAQVSTMVSELSQSYSGAAGAGTAVAFTLRGARLVGLVETGTSSHSSSVAGDHNGVATQLQNWGHEDAVRVHHDCMYYDNLYSVQQRLLCMEGLCPAYELTLLSIDKV